MFDASLYLASRERVDYITNFSRLDALDVFQELVLGNGRNAWLKKDIYVAQNLLSTLSQDKVFIDCLDVSVSNAEKGFIGTIFGCRLITETDTKPMMNNDLVIFSGIRTNNGLIISESNFARLLAVNPLPKTELLRVDFKLSS